MNYPDAPRLDVVDDLFGHAVADPYRWLEDAAAPETEAWSRAQDALARGHLDGLPGRDHLARRLRELMPGTLGAPVAVGDRLFFARREPHQEHVTYCVRDAAGERVLVDPAAVDPSLATTPEGMFPSKEGDRLAYLLSEGGREEAVLHVIDVDSGEHLEPPMLLGRGPDVAWLPGGDELIVVRRLPGGELPEGEEQFHRRVWRHRIGADPSTDLRLFGDGRDKTTYYEVSVSPDGRFLVVATFLGTAPRNDLYLLDVATGAATVVQEGVDAQAIGRVHRDGLLYLHTDRDAPRWRLCVADPERPQQWRDLVPEGDDVLADWAVTDTAVVVVRTHDVASAVTVHDKATGAPRHTVDLPGLGTAYVVARTDHGDDAWIQYSDFVSPAVVLHHDTTTGDTSTWGAAPGAPDVGGITVQQIFATSRDGTRVPAFVVARDGTPRDGTTPTVLYGYGGFNIALTPEYSAAIVAWAEAGGVWVVANLRGGSEYGEEWHRAGMRECKQNVFDDFLAVAEHLVAEGWTTPDRLAVSGGSNGGLLVGAALTQRPDLFRAVVCSAPLLDMVRYELFGLGQTWNDEYGRADDPAELEWLLSYSPYHRVVDGTRYPAVLFTVFEGDTRVDPLHARKLCAALQHATASDARERPVLIRRETDVGHAARAVARTVGLQTDTLSFLAAQTGLALTR